MLSLLVVVYFLVYTASAQIGGHSPFLASPRVTGITKHGDHYDAHVHHDVVDHHGNVHTIHRDVPIPSTIGTVNPFGYNRIGFPNSYNNYYNYNNFNNYNRFEYQRFHPLSGFRNPIFHNTYRRPYITTNTGDFHGHHHGHRHKRAALLPVARYPPNELFPDTSAKSDQQDIGKEYTINQDKINEISKPLSADSKVKSDSENRPFLLLSSTNEIVNTLIIDPSEYSPESSSVESAARPDNSESFLSRSTLDSESFSNTESIKNFKSQLSNIIDSAKMDKEEKQHDLDIYKPKEESIEKSSFPLPENFLPSFKSASYKEDSDYNSRYNDQMRLGFSFNPRRSGTYFTRRSGHMSEDTDYLSWPFRRFSGLAMLNECRNRACGFNSLSTNPYMSRFPYPFYLPTIPQPPLFFW